MKGEAERQRLQREELEMELHAVKHQMQNFKNADADLKRCGEIAKVHFLRLHYFVWLRLKKASGIS